MIRRTPPPMEPYCILGKWPFQMGQPQVIRVPEVRSGWFESHGWRVIVRDSDVPLTMEPGQICEVDVPLVIPPVQSNPQRFNDHGEA